MTRASFFKSIVGAIGASLLEVPLVAASSTTPTIVVTSFSEWVSLIVQAEIDQEIVHDLIRASGKEPPPLKNSEDILADSGYVLRISKKDYTPYYSPTKPVTSCNAKRLATSWSQEAEQDLNRMMRFFHKDL
jgi:hypothetical protein